MKYLKSLVLCLPFVMNVSYGSCEQFPQKNGPVELKTTVHGMNIVVKADFKLATVAQSGVATMHRYGKPKFFVDGKQVNVDRHSATVIFQSLGYDHLEWAGHSTVKFFDRKPLLDGTMRLVTSKMGHAIINPESSVSPYHKKCANWVY